jgi:hypothetical protein
MNLTSFCYFLKLKKAAGLFVPGVCWPLVADWRGPRLTRRQATLAQRLDSLAMAGSCRWTWRRRSGVGTQGGKGSSWTLGSPGASRGGWRGRRQTNGGKIRGGELGWLWVKRRWSAVTPGFSDRFRLWGRGGRRGGARASSKEARVARNSEGRWRPWRRA